MIDQAKKNQIKDFLIILATKRSTTGYLKLNEKLKLGVDFSDEAQMNDLYNTLDDISAWSFREFQVFLGIVIVNKMRNRPSSRFYSGVEKILGSKVEDTESFFDAQREKVFIHFAAK